MTSRIFTACLYIVNFSDVSVGALIISYHFHQFVMAQLPSSNPEAIPCGAKAATDSLSYLNSGNSLVGLSENRVYSQ